MCTGEMYKDAVPKCLKQKIYGNNLKVCEQEKNKLYKHSVNTSFKINKLCVTHNNMGKCAKRNVR